MACMASSSDTYLEVGDLDEHAVYHQRVYIRWNYPPHSNSLHRDNSIFSGESPQTFIRDCYLVGPGGRSNVYVVYVGDEGTHRYPQLVGTVEGQLFTARKASPTSSFSTFFYGRRVPGVFVAILAGQFCNFVANGCVPEKQRLFKRAPFEFSSDRNLDVTLAHEVMFPSDFASQ